MTKKQKTAVAIGSVISIFVGLIILAIIVAVNRKKKLSKKDLMNLVREDVDYWKGLSETDKKGAEKLKEWWSWLGFNFSIDQIMSSVFQSKWYWSAVYISALMKRWGAGDRFKYSTSHSEFIIDGKKARENKDKDSIYWSYRPNEVKVEVGDIIGKPRKSGITYDNLYVGAPTHTDIVYDVVKKDNQWYAYIIGGNVGNTVSIKAVKLDSKKKLENPNKYLVVMKNQVT